MTTMLDLAVDLAAELSAAGAPAVVDVREVLGNLPCVLVPPPRLEYTTCAVRWRLILLSSYNVGSLDAWSELDDLLDAVATVLPVETAEPIAYTLPVGAVDQPSSMPAYAVTLTGSFLP
jgi:hypothetical protein